MILLIVAGCWLVGVGVAWAFCRVAGLADEAMEDLP